eukprot:UN12856
MSLTHSCIVYPTESHVCQSKRIRMLKQRKYVN